MDASLDSTILEHLQKIEKSLDEVKTLILANKTDDTQIKNAVERFVTASQAAKVPIPEDAVSIIREDRGGR